MVSKNIFYRLSDLEQTCHSSSAKLISCSVVGSSVCSHEDLMTKWLFYSDRTVWYWNMGRAVWLLSLTFHLMAFKLYSNLLL